jgi:hypothetical protein
VLGSSFHKRAIISWPFSSGGKNYDVERLQSIHANYLKIREIHRCQCRHGVEHMMVHGTMDRVCQTALPELLFRSREFISG